MNKVQEFAVSNGIKDVFHYGAAEEKCIFEPQAEESGYVRITTFFSDLSMAEWCGLDNVREFFNDVCESWIGDYKYFTELVLCLNIKCWEWYGRKYDELSQLYVELYEQARDKFYDYYEGNDEATSYYFEVTD